MALNLEKQLEFYGSYHHTPMNKAIHMVCVPTILATAFLFGTNTPSLIPLPSWMLVPHLPPNLGTIATFVYATLYVLMEPVAGGLLAPILFLSTGYSHYLTTFHSSTANYTALGLFLTSWIAQFIGHGVFEKRAPALLDNLVQALFLAPFFVWMEILFALGYRPELHARVEKAVGKEVERFWREKEHSAKSVANGKTSST